MKTLLNGWFIAGCFTWFIVIVMRKLGHPLPVLNGYMDDAVAIPVIANLGLWFQRVFIIKNDYYVLAPWHVIFIVAYVTLLFEVLLPSISKSYTSDWIDIFLYLTGGLFFFKIMNRPYGAKVLRAGNLINTIIDKKYQRQSYTMTLKQIFYIYLWLQSNIIVTM